MTTCLKNQYIKWIDDAWPHKRKRRLRNYKNLVELQENDPDSADIFEDNLIYTFYSPRPRQLENVCLYDFVSEYERCSQDDSGNSHADPAWKILQDLTRFHKIMQDLAPKSIATRSYKNYTIFLQESILAR